MTKRKPAKDQAHKEEITRTNKRVSRPEDPDTQRMRRSARLLRTDTLPEGSGVLLEHEHQPEDSETLDALKRATDDRRDD